ncbi:MAG: molybdopterin molybdotransferase MoeA [Thaumarchaeota archaeon]|jgi:molybdopterin molybdotransferase|nr:molybdopterin molybdotransferase MoeA [Candidatus Geocrenenecus arthurdayi]
MKPRVDEAMKLEMEGFKRLTSVEKALQILREVLEKQEKKDTEVLPLLESHGRVCGEDIYAPFDIPSFDRSAVDGYAVIAEDTFSASPSNPIELKIVGSLMPGDEPGSLRIDKGEAVEVATGAPLPLNANAVIMAEDAKEIKPGLVEVYKQVHPFQNVSRKGEDFKMGELVVKRGTRIKPWHIGALASLNISHVKVFSKPRIGILSTGSELVELGSELKPGKIVNSSKIMLKALISSCGGEPVDLGTVEDDVELISEKIEDGLKNCDALITTGGTSIGRRDLVFLAVNLIGKVLVHGLAMRPGKPTGFGLVRDKLVFMLSGFPVAALIGFNLFVKPTIEALLGTRSEPSPKIVGRLKRRVASLSGMRSYVRVRLVKYGDSYIVEPLRLTGSGLISTLTEANGLLVIPENLEGYDEGEEVEVELFDPVIHGNQT